MRAGFGVFCDLPMASVDWKTIVGMQEKPMEIRVSIAQIDVVQGDPDSNIERGHAKKETMPVRYATIVF